MIKDERKTLIYDYLTQNGFTSVEALGEKFFSSKSSIRRDLGELERLGLVKRSWGGARAIAVSPTSVTPFERRSYSAPEEKRSIAKKAAKLITAGQIIFLDQSSTSYFLALEIMSAAPITVVTNNLEILSLLSHSEHTVISVGGTVSKENRNCLIGSPAERGFEGIFADLAFFSAKALSDDGVISDCTMEEIFVRDAMLKSAKKKIFLCDSTKLGSRSAYKQCRLSDIDVLITDAELGEKFREAAPHLCII